MYHTTDHCIKLQQAASFPDYKRVEIEDAYLIQAIVHSCESASCEYNFVNLFAWEDGRDLFWTLYKGRLLVIDKTNDMCLMPIGDTPLPPEEMKVLSETLISMGLPGNFTQAHEAYLNKFPGIEAFYEVTPRRDDGEYLYELEKLKSLPGRKLHKKRNLIKQFKERYADYKILPLTGRLRDRTLEFALSMIQNLEKRQGPSKELQQEKTAIRNAFKHFDDLNLQGLVVELNRKVVAFSAFSRLDRNTFNVHFEKADIRFKGAAQVINQETAVFLEGKCKYLNREQDLGIPGLRQAKKSYDPSAIRIPSSLKFRPAE